MYYETFICNTLNVMSFCLSIVYLIEWVRLQKSCTSHFAHYTYRGRVLSVYCKHEFGFWEVVMESQLNLMLCQMNQWNESLESPRADESCRSKQCKNTKNKYYY